MASTKQLTSKESSKASKACLHPCAASMALFPRNATEVLGVMAGHYMGPSQWRSLAVNVCTLSAHEKQARLMSSAMNL